MKCLQVHRIEAFNGDCPFLNVPLALADLLFKE